jgi:hypothetical protein
MSSKDQEREGVSIAAQQRLRREYASEDQLLMLGEFTDVETAKQAGRAQLCEMLAYLKPNPACPTILGEKTERLYRNIKDSVAIDELGVIVQFVKENAIVSAVINACDEDASGRRRAGRGVIGETEDVQRIGEHQLAWPRDARRSADLLRRNFPSLSRRGQFS